MSEGSEPLSSSLRDLIDAPLTVLDIGAAGTFRELPRLAPLCVLHTFEARAEEATQSDGYAAIYRHKVALAGAAGKRDFFVTTNGDASSMLKPNKPVIDRWAAESRDEIFGFDLARTETMDCTTLDAIAAQHDIRSVDYIKIDTQGTELEILLGGERMLQNTSVIRAEAEFVELYEGQPLFDDMVRELSKRGFRFVNFGYGQKVGVKRIWSDVVFARRSLAGQQAVKAAAVLLDLGYETDAFWIMQDAGIDPHTMEEIRTMLPVRPRRVARTFRNFVRFLTGTLPSP